MIMNKYEQLTDKLIDSIGFRLAKDDIIEDNDFNHPLLIHTWRYKTLVVEKVFTMVDSDKWELEFVHLRAEAEEDLSIEELQVLNKLTNVIFKEE